MGNNFTDVMTKKTDSELLEIVTKLKDDYQAEAVEAAKEEIKNRNLSDEKIEQAEKEIIEKEIKQKDKENEPLETVQRIMFFIFFWGVIPWLISSTFKNNGYLKKYKDAWRFMKYGFFTYLGLIISMFLIVNTFDTKTNQTDKSVNRKELFHAFMKKFKPVDLPYVFRLTNNDNDNVDGLERIDPMSSDSLFIKIDDMAESFCFGYLTDTSTFYTLIFKFAADTYYPVLITYTKDGEIISQEAILANGCGADCGLTYWSENAVVSKDFSIFCSDTSKWEYFCDSIGEPMPNSAETWIYYKKGQVKSNGIIDISKCKEFKIKNDL